MSFADLPSELLGEIFLLVDGSYDSFGGDPYALTHKFTLSHVCAAWRSTALQLPLLWSHIYVKTNSEVLNLPTALARSSSVPLDVRITWQSDIVWKREISLDKSDRLIDTLLAHRAQLKRLTIDWVTGLPQALTRLIGSGVDFPILEEISARGVDKLPCNVDISAPLRSLSLQSQQCAAWESLFTPGLHRLEIDGCYPYLDAASMQALVFRACPNLRELVLHTGHALNMSANLSNTPLQHVRSLSLSMMDTSVMVDIIRTGFANIVPEITALVSDYSMSTEMKALLAELLRGITLTNLEFSWTHRLDLVDRDQGMRRIISSWTAVAGEWNWRELWAELASRNANHTLRVLELSCVNWNEIIPAIAVHPLGAQDVELVVELYGSSFDYKYTYNDEVYSDDDDDNEEDNDDDYVDVDDDDSGGESAQDEENPEPVLKPKPSRERERFERELVPVPLNIPNLRRIVLTNSLYYTGDEDNIPRVEFIGKILDAISSDAATIEVCVSGAGLEEEREPVSVSAYAELHLKGKYSLCSHCVSS